MPAQAARCSERHAAPAGADAGSLMTRRWRGVDFETIGPARRKRPFPNAKIREPHRAAYRGGRKRICRCRFIGIPFDLCAA